MPNNLGVTSPARKVTAPDRLCSSTNGGRPKLDALAATWLVTGRFARCWVLIFLSVRAVVVIVLYVSVLERVLGRIRVVRRNFAIVYATKNPIDKSAGNLGHFIC